MEKIYWTKDEVIAYLEYKILKDEATDNEIKFYEAYIWNDKFYKNTYTYKRILQRMMKEYKGE
ncbi:hypothetical protein COE51_16490 [Bacillus pseudomycoides]|nr:hypothetical protein COE51_16490 [Bacillus pseudomycoides]